MNISSLAAQSFAAKQKEYQRVKKAYSDKAHSMKKLLKEKGINTEFEIYLRAFKSEEQLEVWVREKEDTQYILLITYAFCTSSGGLGPKRKQGDMQIPEGLYYVDRFNPVSNFYLSLGINYPNASDKILGNKSNPGGDIFIHGDCVTIGCIPITDDKIKELYYLAVEAKSAGQDRIPVHIFPAKLTDDKLVELKKTYKEPELFRFWQNLAEAYQYFEENKIVPVFKIAEDGSYIF